MQLKRQTVAKPTPIVNVDQVIEKLIFPDGVETVAVKKAVITALKELHIEFSKVTAKTESREPFFGFSIGTVTVHHPAPSSFSERILARISHQLNAITGSNIILEVIP